VRSLASLSHPSLDGSAWIGSAWIGSAKMCGRLMASSRDLWLPWMSMQQHPDEQMSIGVCDR
jgi:hypothetical protein